MPDIPIAELASRIQAAREFRRRTFGEEYITPELFGDPVDHADQRFRELGKKYRADESLEQKRQRAIKQFQAAKLRYGGCQGIIRHKRKDGTYRYEIRLVTHCESFDCAVEAAECRNLVMARYWPGVDEVLCDLDAVFRRFGCVCGKHERGKR